MPGKPIIITDVKVVSAETGSASGTLDVSIDESGRIAGLKHALKRPANAALIDGEGACVSPGWIDMHTHVYDGVSDIGLPPARIGLSTGVHAVADAGSAGEANFAGFRKYIIETSETAIVPFLNVGSIGLVKTNKISELETFEDVDLDGIARCMAANSALIRGIKVRCSGVVVKEWGVEPLVIARHVAEAYGLPLVVHVGEPLPFLDQILEVVRPGDVITHCYHGKRGGSVTDTRDGLRLVLEAQRSGVLFDVGHGAASFDFGVAERALEAGFLPDTIGTDLHVRSIEKGVWDLCTTMTKMLNLGMSIDQVIKAVTLRPAAFLGIACGRGPAVGDPANLTLFRIIDCDLVARDSVGNTRKQPRFILPLMTIRGNEIRTAHTNNPAVTPFITGKAALRSAPLSGSAL